MAPRLIVLAVCVAAVVVLVGRRSDDAACREALRAAFGAARAPATVIAGTLRDDCHDVDRLASGAVTMLVAGRPPDAVALARTAARRGPDVFAAGPPTA